MKIYIEKVLDNVARIIGKSISGIINYRNQIRLSILEDKIYSYANAKYFRSFGPGARIARNSIIINPRYISIGSGSTIGYNCTISAWDRDNETNFEPNITIGDNTSIGSECHLTAIKNINIGNGVLLGKKITISDNSHGDTDYIDVSIAPARRKLICKGGVTIEDNVWIGDKVTILSGSSIGYGSIIGANSVVNSVIPPKCVAVGVPARIVRKINKPNS